VVRRRVHEKANSDLICIWTLLELTGCRVSEISGLLKSDVVIEGVPNPHITIQFHEHRRLKNRSSIRDIPLVPEALRAVQMASIDAGDSQFLFPRCGERRGGDRVSAALMKHVRAVSKATKLTVHSLRHTLKDKMSLAGVSLDIQEMVLGHAGDGMKRLYGGSAARLAVTTKALEQTFGDQAVSMFLPIRPNSELHASLTAILHSVRPSIAREALALSCCITLAKPPVVTEHRAIAVFVLCRVSCLLSFLLAGKVGFGSVGKSNERQHDGDFYKHAHHCCERGTRVEAKQADGHGDCQFKEV